MFSRLVLNWLQEFRKKIREEEWKVFMKIKRRFTAVFIAVAMALVISGVWEMRAYAAVQAITTNQIVLEGKVYTRNYGDGVEISGYGATVTYDNRGTTNVGVRFNLYNAVFQNQDSGTFVFTGSSSSSNFSLSGSASFVNDGTATITGVYNFGVQEGTSFINNGMLFIEDVKYFNLAGFENNGTIVIPDEEYNGRFCLELEAKNKGGGQVYSQSQYEAKKLNYVISYELDGDYGITNDNPDYYEWVMSDPQEITLNDPVRAGYNFIGWTGLDVETPTKNFTFSSDVCRDITVTAHWEPIVYRITYDLDGGSFYEGQIPNETYTIGQQPGLLIPYKTGYTFAGWIGSDGQKVGSGTEIYYLPPGSMGDKAFKADFIANTDTRYSVICFYEEPDGSYTEQKHLLTGETGGKVSVSGGDYIKEGYSFDSENLQNSLSGTIAANNSLELWIYYKRSKYTVTYKSQDGTETLWTAEKYYKDPVGEYGGADSCEEIRR